MLLTLTGVTGTGGVMVSSSGSIETGATGKAEMPGRVVEDELTGVVFRFMTLATNRFLLALLVLLLGELFSSESVLTVLVMKWSIFN